MKKTEIMGIVNVTPDSFSDGGTSATMPAAVDKSLRLLCLGVLLAVNALVPIDRYVIVALYVIAAMPTASSVLNFAEMFGGDCDTAAATTLMSTLLCILTVPVLMLLLS